MFLPINDEHARKELNLVTEQLEGHRTRQESGIHENTFAERHLVRDRPWLAKSKVTGPFVAGRLSPANRIWTLVMASLGWSITIVGTSLLPVVKVTRQGPLRVRRCSMLW